MMLAIDDGTIRFTLSGPDGETSHEVDALLAWTAAGEVAARHHAGGDDKAFVPTADFLQELADDYARRFALPRCSPTIAMRIWHRATIEVTTQKKSEVETPKLPTDTALIPDA